VIPKMDRILKDRTGRLVYAPAVAEVAFTPNLARHVECARREAPGASVREVLDGVFADNPRLRGYVVDERGALRKHMIVFVDGRQITDREQLSDPVAPGSELYVMQALSGG
jgi:sulfur-carrier protein